MKKTFYIIPLLFALTVTSCNLLDIQPINSMIPQTVEQFESILLGGYPRTEFFMRTELATDNIYANLNSGRTPETAYEPWYTWAGSHMLPDATDTYWQNLYKSIYYANTVLDEFAGRTPAPEEQTLFEQVRGEAYALRAYCYFYLVNLYAEPYSEENLTKLGVPMPLSASDVNLYTQDNDRGTVGAVYDQIVIDLENAATDLAGKESTSLYRFNQVSVEALKARVYLFMGRYTDAIASASTVIASKSLYDMNKMQDYIDDKGNKYAFSYDFGFIDTDYKNEVLFFVGGNALNNMYYYSTYVFKPAPELLTDISYKYAPHREDYRHYIFEPYNATLNDSVTIGPTVYHMFATQTRLCYYVGLKLSEAYVTRAEAYARTGNKQAAVQDINRLLVNRYKTGTFTDLQASDYTDATLLSRILDERRLELALEGGMRWFDLRRLGKPRLTHAYKNGLEYVLEQGDLRYVLQIPDSEIANSPNMPLNPR
ncbi:MAG: RagB/SusD family nutrient uptake outer membrane protein [Dysgonamonadaceae bacterium]|jgi:hypothetical protein|nr:RagB/SusD family nutrient uptake outer membrane protein [Dysgonamonadaceae bacterium]